MRITEALAGGLEGSDVRAFDVAPGVVETPMTGRCEVAGPHRVDPAEQRRRVRRSDRRRESTSGPDGSCGPARTMSRHCATVSPRRPSASSASAPTGTTTRWPDRLPDVSATGGH